MVVSHAFYLHLSIKHLSYLLGSTIVMPYGDSTVKPIEIGGSVFVSANKNLVRAVKEYNLSVTDFGEEAEEAGIWDGQQFVITVSSFVGCCP